MCYNGDSTPPVDPIEGGASGHEDLVLTAADGNAFAAFAATSAEGGVSGHEDLVLTAADGNAFAAFAATSAEGKGPGVVILPDVRGLHHFYEELALRFAEHGYDAVALDYFGRTAGVAKRDDEFPYKEHVPLTTLEGVTADTAAAVAHLRDQDPSRPVFTLGFCFGGSNSWHQAAAGHGLAGAIGFYGNPRRPPLGPIEHVDRFSCPILALMAGNDPGIPGDVVDEFRQALDGADVAHEVVVYSDAPHSFFDRQQESFARESADAWSRVLEFIEEHG